MTFDPPFTSIKIGMFTYDVVWERPDNDEYGECDHAKLVIRVDPAHHHDVRVSSFWHEVGHAIRSIVLGGEDGAEMDDEQIAVMISRHVPAVLRDNPKMTEWTLTRSTHG